MAESNVELVRRGWEAAARRDVDVIADLLAPDVYWGGPRDRSGNKDYGCHTRKQALRWMREGISRGINVELVDARELRGGRVLAVLQRTTLNEDETELPGPHAQLIRIRDGKIAEMVVYPSAEDAIQAAERR